MNVRSAATTWVALLAMVVIATTAVASDAVDPGYVTWGGLFDNQRVITATAPSPSAINGHAIVFQSAGATTPVAGVVAQADSLAAGLRPLSPGDDRSAELFAQMRQNLVAGQDQNRKALETLIKQNDTNQEVSEDWRKEWEKTTTASNLAAINAVALATQFAQGRVQGALAAATDAEQRVVLERAREQLGHFAEQWEKADVARFGAAATINAIDGDKRSTFIDGAMMTLQKALDPGTPQGAGIREALRITGPEVATILAAASSIIDSSLNLTTYYESGQRMKQIAEGSDQYLAAEKALDAQGRALVEALRTSDALNVLVAQKGDALTSSDIIGVLSRVSPRALDLLVVAARRSIDADVPVATADSSGDASSIQRASPEQPLMSGIVPDPKAAKATMPAGRESDYFYQLQMRQTGPGAASGSGRSTSSIMGKRRAPQRRLPTWSAGGGSGTAWRAASHWEAGPPSQAPTDTDMLRRMHEQQRAKEATQFPTAPGGVAGRDGPCPTCGGSGRIDISGENAAAIAKCQQLMAQADAAVASTPDFVRDSRGNIIADNRAAKARYRQAAAQARSQLASLPKSKVCPTCAGTGRVSR